MARKSKDERLIVVDEFVRIDVDEDHQELWIEPSHTDDVIHVSADRLDALIAALTEAKRRLEAQK